MRVALINPNRYLSPVIPVGVEYLAHYLERERHEIRVIDLTFAADPQAALREALRDFDPQVAGFSLRNLDTSLLFDNVFLLDTSAALISACRDACEARVVVGGSALLAGPARSWTTWIAISRSTGPGNWPSPLSSATWRGERLHPVCATAGAIPSTPRRSPGGGARVDYASYLSRRGSRIRHPGGVPG